jgi:hypothetical protein
LLDGLSLREPASAPQQIAGPFSLEKRLGAAKLFRHRQMDFSTLAATIVFAHDTFLTP